MIRAGTLPPNHQDRQRTSQQRHRSAPPRGNTSKPWPENCAYVQAHHRQAGQPALPAETPSSIRALDRGAGCVTVNDLVKTVHENESIYVPIGAVHRLENPGKILLELIEVQTGRYFGEDDIIRIEDDYRRS
jgi:hypothetical protein